MRTYILRRLLLSIPTLFLVSLVVFFMIRLIPGSIIDIMIVQTELVSPSDMARVKEQLGLDVPVHLQYARWMWDIVGHGSFGSSLWTKLPVTHEILARVPVTLELGLLALIVAQLIAVPIGIYSAIPAPSERS